MKRIILIAWIVLSTSFLLFSQDLSQTTERIALVIGNGDYEGMAKLANLVNDAEDLVDLGDTLISLGVDAEVLTDGTLYVSNGRINTSFQR
jgi:hypothetical protein